MKKNIYLLICFCFSASVIFAQGNRGTSTSTNNTLNITELEQELIKVSDSLYAAKYEVTNAEYAVFLQNNSNKKVQVDSMGWKRCVNNMDDLVAYHRHIAFLKYPVVNITFEAAEAYCKWLTDTYNQNPARKYSKVLFRLPSEIEWEKAARSGNPNAIYSWNGIEVLDSKGNYYCNFGDMMVIQHDKHGKHKSKSGHFEALDHHLITAPVKSYQANALGLYNMCGNAAEMTLEKGYTKGGSWYSKREKLEIGQSEMYQQAEPFVGFRIFMEVIKL